jgi:hypothetical protein
MKTVKILTVLILIFGVITLNSCKKDKKNPIPTPAITANIDGTATTFNVHAIGAKGTVDGMSITSIQGSTSNGVNISITLNGTLTAGTTYSATGPSTDSEPLIQLSTSSDDFLNDDSSTTNPVSVTITSISSTAIAGTFKGSLATVTIGNTQPGTKSVTEGKFSVSF